MTLVRFLPGRSRDLTSLRTEMDQLFESIFSNRPMYAPADATDTLAPPVDIEENAEGYVFRADLPGMTDKDVKVSLVGDTLTLRGERKRESEVKDDHYHRVERAYGAFSRSFSLPATVDAGNVRADYKDGVLTVVLPTREEAKPRQIQVQVNG